MYIQLSTCSFNWTIELPHANEELLNGNNREERSGNEMPSTKLVFETVQKHGSFAPVGCATSNRHIRHVLTSRT